MENTLVRIDGKLDKVGEKIREIENTAISVIQDETQRGKNELKKKKEYQWVVGQHWTTK